MTHVTNRSTGGIMSARFTKLMQLTTAATLLAVASVAGAQGKAPSGPPVTTKGATQANAHAAKGQATAQASRTEARADKAEHSALRRARTEPAALLKGVKLTKAERKSVEEIEKRYSAQIKDMEKQENAAEKAGTPDATIVSKLDALRAQERAELRAAIPAPQQARFDRNSTAFDAKK